MSNKHAMNSKATDRSPYLRTFITLVLGVAVVVIAGGIAGRVSAQALSSRNALNRLAQQGGGDAASTMFRGGRDLITEQQWAKAEEACC